MMTFPDCHLLEPHEDVRVIHTRLLGHPEGFGYRYRVRQGRSFVVAAVVGDGTLNRSHGGKPNSFERARVVEKRTIVAR